MKELESFNQEEVRDIVMAIRAREMYTLPQLSKSLGISLTTLSHLRKVGKKHVFSFKIQKHMIKVLNAWIRNNQ